MSSDRETLTPSIASTSRLPNLIVIGAMKAGTTSLHFYLNQHPKISMSKEKELNFFSRNWAMGIDWYTSQFGGEADIYGESSPSYTDYPYFSGVPGRMHQVLPDAKLIYVVRDPIERIISQYIHWSQTDNPPSLSEALADFEKSRYVQRSKYYMQLEQYLQFYPTSRILLITQEELLNCRQETLKKVFRFLDVDASFYSPKYLQIRHKSRDKRQKGKIGESLSQIFEATRLKQVSPNLAWHLERLVCLPFSRPITRPSLSPRLEQELIAYLKEDTEQLEKFVGKRFEEWSTSTKR